MIVQIPDDDGKERSLWIVNLINELNELRHVISNNVVY